MKLVGVINRTKKLSQYSKVRKGALCLIVDSDGAYYLVILDSLCDVIAPYTLIPVDWIDVLGELGMIKYVDWKCPKCKRVFKNVRLQGLSRKESCSQCKYEKDSEYSKEYSRKHYQHKK